jgi:Skp family chaperone for outer membrane proteins
LRLQQENVRLKAELLKTQKQLQAAQEENRNLVSALEKNEQLRARYKQQIASLQSRH